MAAMEPDSEPAARTAPATFSAELVPLPALAHVEGQWRALQGASDHSFFQSWGWIGCWLRLLPDEVKPLLLRVRRGPEIVGLGIVGERTIRRYRLIRSRVARLNETGIPEIDKLAIEHNGVLVRRDCADEARDAALTCLATELRAGRWDEIILAGVDPTYHVAAARACGGSLNLRTLRDAPSYLVEIGAIRQAGGAIPDALRAGLRKEARRALRTAEQIGPLTVEEARTAEEAQAFLAALIPLHEARWAEAGELGAFFSPWLRRFHPALVESRFPAGEIQMLRVSVGGAPIGYLYHFRYGRRLYGYQWGLALDTHRGIKPGLLCDTLSLRHNLDQPVDVFDFLHGESEYKRRFATGQDRRLWLAMQRPRLCFQLENALRDAWRRYRRRRALKPAGAPVPGEA
jgi:CelD/BcsL family acetyltransferase involved in cellulose biosynthesis